MARIKQNPNGRGSLNDIQILINKNQDILNNKIKSIFPELSAENIIWKSPIAMDEFSEYRDNDFLDLLGLDPGKVNLASFWPRRGPQWDALARTTNGHIILVEAKANMPEIISPATGASAKSKLLIDKSLNETKEFLGISNDVNWSGKFYQYTNRLAHLYLFRCKRGIPAYLLNIYFIGDKTVNGPSTISEWVAAIKVAHSYLGIFQHELNKYIAEIFIDVEEMSK